MNEEYLSSEKNKKILIVIGNGFDLFHNLPVKFEDFVNFIKNCNEILKPYHQNGNPRNEKNEKFIFNFNRENFIESFSEFMENGKFDPEYIIPLSNFHNKLNKESANFFFNYFDLEEPKPDLKMNWNNFEIELLKILELIDNYYMNKISYVYNKSYFVNMLKNDFDTKNDAIKYIYTRVSLILKNILIFI